MIHNVILTNRKGFVLFKRYYDFSSPEEESTWETDLFLETNEEWEDAKTEIHHVTKIGNKFVTFTGVGELFIFISGSEEYDELLLSEILEIIVEILKDNFTGKTATASKEVSEGMLIENYDRFVLSLDYLISCQGDLHITDTLLINGMLEMKPLKEKKEKKAAKPSSVSVKPSPQVSTRNSHPNVDTSVGSLFRKQYFDKFQYHS